MFGRRDELRVAALLLAGLLAVHQLRYALAFGEAPARRSPSMGTGIWPGADPLIGLAITCVTLRITWQSWQTVRGHESDAHHRH